jgi:hypothetical protein
MNLSFKAFSNLSNQRQKTIEVGGATGPFPLNRHLALDLPSSRPFLKALSIKIVCNLYSMPSSWMRSYATTNDGHKVMKKPASSFATFGADICRRNVRAHTE